MSDTLKATLLDLKTRQANGEHMSCPRCGQGTMNPSIHRNALSRHADIYVCDDCGTAEAMLVVMRNPLPLPQWACLKQEYAQADFEALSGEAVWERLQQVQLPYLIRLFERWRSIQDQEDFEVYRLDAQCQCAGLTALWDQPFHATYRVKDGHLLIRFRATETGTKVTHYLIQEPGR